MRFTQSLEADLAMLRSALAGVRAVVNPPAPSGLTYVNASFWPLVVIVFVIGIPPDAFVRHLLVPQAYLGWNLAVDAIALLSALWLCGLFGSMAAFPHEVGPESVRFHLGAFGRLACAPSEIAGIERIEPAQAKGLRMRDRAAGFLTVPGGHTVRVTFHRPVALARYPFLRTRSVERLYVSSDRPLELIALVDRCAQGSRASTMAVASPIAVRSHSR